MFHSSKVLWWGLLTLQLLLSIVTISPRMTPRPSYQTFPPVVRDHFLIGWVRGYSEGEGIVG